MVSLALIFGLALSSGGAPAPGAPTAAAVRARTPPEHAWYARWLRDRRR